MPTGYDGIYNSLLPKLALCDIPKQAEHLGFRVSGKTALASFLGREYSITNEGVFIADGGPPAHINNYSLLIYYILSEGHVTPKNSFVPIGRLTGSIEGRNSQEGWFIGDHLLRETEGKYALFAEAAKALGGEYAGVVGGGECWQFLPLPKMPVRVIFFEADAEFPAEMQFLFDETAPYYMAFECLAFLTGSVILALRDIVKNIKNTINNT